MPQFHQLHIFNGSLMLILEGPGVRLASCSSQKHEMKTCHFHDECDLLKKLNMIHTKGSVTSQVHLRWRDFFGHNINLKKVELVVGWRYTCFCVCVRMMVALSILCWLCTYSESNATYTRCSLHMNGRMAESFEDKYETRIGSAPLSRSTTGSFLANVPPSLLEICKVDFA